jgi:RND superfamily putative drug exporter
VSSTLYRLGRAMAAAKWKVVAVWAALMVVLGGLAVGLGGEFSSEFSIPGTESQQGLDNLANRFPEMGGTSGQVVFVATDGTVDDHEQQIQDTMDRIGDIDGIDTSADPFDKDVPGTRNDDDSAIMGNIQSDDGMGDFPATSVDELEKVVKDANGDGLEAHVGGQLLQSTEVPFGAGEVIGVLIALMVLAIVFKSFVPAWMPIATGATGVGISMLAVMALSAGIEMPSVTTALGAMLGLAVGIDYALFIVSRHRDQLRRGEDVRESIGQALATSGSAVIFAGLTVIIALVGLFVTAIPFVTVMGVAAGATVAVAVMVALTLLPALMGILGELLRPRRIRKLMAANGGVLPAEDPQDGTKRKKPFGTTWVRVATKVPALTILVVVVALGALAIPIKDLQLALPDQGTDAPGSETRVTYDLTDKEFGPGYNGPLLVTADIINTDDPLDTVDSLEDDIKGLDHVKEVQIATPNRGADLAVVSVIPDGGPTDQSTKDLVHELRDHASTWEDDLGVSDVTVTGSTAVGIDITDKLNGALLPFGIFVVGLSLILLALVFRSIWVPIKASVGYLFSVGAAFGVTAMVFQYGWFNGPLNVGVNGPIVAFAPIMVMGVLFGLAMDYEVFLVSRMREEYVHTGDAKGSIERGFTASAPVVIAAALIMTAVFAGFVTSGWFMLQPIAVALAVGVLVDAFVVRMTLVPAVLALLGKHAWWLPRWLDKLLPKVDVEGEGLHAILEHRRWTEENGATAIRLDELVAPLVGARGTIGPLTGSVTPGTLLVVRSSDDPARTAFLDLVSGRLKPTSGILAVHDRLAPDDLGAIQAGAYRIEDGEDVAARLDDIHVGRRTPHELIVIEDMGDLAHAVTVTDGGAVTHLEELLEAGATVIIGSRSPADAGLSATERHVVEALRDPSRHLALRVQRATPPAPAPDIHDEETRVLDADLEGAR